MYDVESSSKVLDRIHLYIGPDKLPKMRSGEYTDLPVHFPVEMHEDEIGTDESQAIVEYDTDMYDKDAGYLIANAVVCDPIGTLEYEDSPGGATAGKDDSSSAGDVAGSDSESDSASLLSLSNPVFYVLGDTPYFASHEKALQRDLEELTEGDFLVHVGDIRFSARGARVCKRSQYEDAAEILKGSPVPVFMIIGDNDVSDWLDLFCRNTSHDKLTKTHDRSTVVRLPYQIRWSRIL